jgi:hypothetical protein
MQYKAGVVRRSIFSWCSMHDIIFKRSDVFVGISLGDKVVEFGSIEDSQRVFTRWCPCALQSLGTLWCWDIWKMEKGRRHWHITSTNAMGCTLSVSQVFWTCVQSWWHLKTAVLSGTDDQSYFQVQCYCAG